MKKKVKIQVLSFSVCIFFLGIISLTILNTRKSSWENTESGYQITDIERENLEHRWMEKNVVSILERSDKIQWCEVDINWSESEIFGVDVKVTMSAGNIGEDTLKTDIAECLSRMLDISTESIVILFVNEDLS